MLTVNKANLNLDVLVRYAKESQLTGYITALEEAQRTLERTLVQNPAKEKRDLSDKTTKKSIYEQERARLRRCRERDPQVQDLRRRRTAWWSTTFPNRRRAAAARSNRSWPRASRSAKARS